MKPAAPGLELVDALLIGRGDVDGALDALERAAASFRDHGDDERELAALHNAIILAVNEGRTRRARRAVLQILRLRRLATSRHARHLALLFLAMGAFLRGRYGLARRLSDRAARHDFAPRERGGLILGRTQLALLAGELERAVELTEEGLAEPAQRRHGPSYYTLFAFHAAARDSRVGTMGAPWRSSTRPGRRFASFVSASARPRSPGYWGSCTHTEGVTKRPCPLSSARFGCTARWQTAKARLRRMR